MPIINMSLIAIPLIIAITAIRFFTLYKLPKKTFYVLWGIVLYQLFIPYNLFVRFYVFKHITILFDRVKDIFIKIPEIIDIAINVENPINAATDTANIIAETASPSVQTVIYNIYDIIDRFGRNIFGRIETINISGTDIITKTTENTAEQFNLHISPLLLIWLAGFLFCTAYFIIVNIKFRRIYSEALPIDNSFVRAWRVEYSDSTRRKIKIKQSDLITSPLTYGIFRPVVLLPETIGYTDNTTLEYILLHEYTHIWRFDILAKLLLIISLCVHWFNPFVWLLYVLANRDIELSCDEAVVKKSNINKSVNPKSDYALTLVALEEKRRFLALGSYFSKNIMKERIKSIMKIPPKSNLRIIAAVILISMITVMFAALQSCENDIAFEGNIQYIQDDAPFVMQEPTNKLVLYKYYYNNWILTAALNIFRKKYPDVEIEIREFDSEDTVKAMTEYKEIMKAEISTGKGPDLILGYADWDFPDIYKTMDTGVFLDLNPFLENDSDFYFSDYNKVVLDSCLYKGKRYIMPVEYNVPVLLTTQEILDAEGIPPSDLATFDGFIKTLEKYNDKYKDNPDKSVFKKYTWIEMVVANSFPWCGIDLIDYSANKVDLDNPYFKSIIETMKWSYISNEDAQPDGFGEVVEALQNQEWLFHPMTMDNLNISRFYWYCSRILEKKLTPVFFQYPSIDNKSTAKVNRFAAIPKTSQNQINAYNLMKIILSEDIQTDMSACIEIPVLKSAVRTQSELQMYGYDYEWESEKYNTGGLQPLMPEREMNKYIDLLINVDSCKLMANTPYFELFVKEMTPYFDGKKSFKECAKILKDNLEIYLSD